MTLRSRSLRITALLAIVLAAPVVAPAGVIVNIDARYYGYAESATIPAVGEVVTPVVDAPGGLANQLILTAGTYKVTNASGEFGALFDAFRFNVSTGESWVWNFLITNASEGNKAVLFGEGSGLGATAEDVAAQSAVQDYSATFTLTKNAALNFMIRDYYLGDNAGGVSLLIQQVGPIIPVAVPEPTGLVLLGVGSLLAAATLVRRRSA
ncbi:PEP-CTERM sorting domain-containing protein [Paludisphaera soli]|uniref:PEP-CTERM sorting domain-containing protein n=1 Tax=Paludisphaera soli TaxID=2712865 RepID=UPI0013EDDD9A|nr:PEP-CTERM sorting domain-containing protein [Paludisphaera soli]